MNTTTLKIIIGFMLGWLLVSYPYLIWCVHDRDDQIKILTEQLHAYIKEKQVQVVGPPLTNLVIMYYYK